MEDNKHWVFVLTNRSIPGIVFLRSSTNPPSSEAQQLSNKSVAGTVYDVRYEVLSQNPDEIIGHVNYMLEKKRLQWESEAYKCTLAEIINLIQMSGVQEAT